jgi:hypothetical protein
MTNVIEFELVMSFVSPANSTEARYVPVLCVSRSDAVATPDPFVVVATLCVPTRNVTALPATGLPELVGQRPRQGERLARRPLVGAGVHEVVSRFVTVIAAESPPLLSATVPAAV